MIFNGLLDIQNQKKIISELQARKYKRACVIAFQKYQKIYIYKIFRCNSWFTMSDFLYKKYTPKDKTV